MRRGVLMLIAMLLVSSAAFAQSATQRPAFLYEISFGGGTRTTDGNLRLVPSGATPPGSGQFIGMVSLDGGFQLAPRVAAIAISEITAGGSTGLGRWGAVGIYGAGRVRVVRRVWLEAGGGVSGLGYSPPSQVSLNGTRFWAPAAEGAGGFDLIRTPEFAMSILARGSNATFDGLAIRSFSVQLALTGWH